MELDHKKRLRKQKTCYKRRDIVKRVNKGQNERTYFVRIYLPQSVQLIFRPKSDFKNETFKKYFLRYYKF